MPYKAYDTPFSNEQLCEFHKLVGNAFFAAFFKIATKFDDPEETLRALRNNTSVLQARIEPSLEEAIRSMKLLARLRQIKVVTTENYSTGEFYQNSPNLFVGSEFRTKVVNPFLGKLIQAGTVFPVNIDVIGGEIKDTEVENRLPGNHCFPSENVGAVIAALITRQPKGEAGDLENTGHVNIFYTTDGIIGLHWGPLGTNWICDAWHREDCIWRKGDRVFSPAH